MVEPPPPRSIYAQREYLPQKMGKDKSIATQHVNRSWCKSHGGTAAVLCKSWKSHVAPLTVIICSCQSIRACACGCSLTNERAEDYKSPTS